ncbi:MAG: hypothetical protein ACYDAD_01075 [Acidimicrobiales bacterium]
MSTKPSDLNHPDGPDDVIVDTLVAAVGAKPVTNLEDLDRYAADIWESDDELEAFLADVRASRNADLA